MSVRNNIKTIKSRSRLRRIFSKIINFICALIIFFVILFATGAFMQADIQSKNILGNQEYQIFSYGKSDDGTAVFKAFGESVTIDLNQIYTIKERFDEVSLLNKDFTPSFIAFVGDIIGECIFSVGESLEKIPDIIRCYMSE